MGFVRSLFVVTLVACVVHAADTTAERLAKEGAKAEKSGETVRAYLLYAQAAAADRRNPSYWARAEALRPMAEAQSTSKLPTPELTEPPKPRRGGPELFGTFTAEDLDALERMADPPRLQPSTAIKTFSLRGDAKALFEQVAREFGYTVIFDKDYNPTGTVRFNVAEMGYREALHALEEATNSFIVPISDKAMMVAQDTQQKRTDLENDEAVAIPIPQRTSVQDAQELLTLVQQAFEIRRAVVDPQRRMVFLRDRASKVEAARMVLNQMSAGKPQVSIEVEFISSALSSSLSLGLSLPNSFPIVDFGRVLNSNPFVPTGFLRFLTFGGGRTFFGIGITDAQLFATASRASATTLLHSTIVASDGQPASLHVGDKYPIVTAGYLGYGNLPGNGNGGTTTGVISTTPYADIASSAVSTTGNMKLIVNSVEVPFLVNPATNNVIGVETIINSLQAGVFASTVERGTNNKPLSMALIANGIGITSIQLVDDPDGAKINLMKDPSVLSAITVDINDATQTQASTTGTLSLTVNDKTFPITLDTTKNNLNGLRDAINAAQAGVTASVLLSNVNTGSVFMQVVADSKDTTTLQLYEDPSGANTALLTRTDEVNQIGSAIGSTNGSSTTTQNTSNIGNLGSVYTPPPTFTFEDLGLVMKITPFVHNAEEVSLDVEAEFKTLGAGSYNGVPVISTRKFQGKVRLKSAEWAVVAGLVTDSQSRSISGIPGLMHLPGLGVVLRDNDRSRDQTNVLIVIKPRITSLPPSESSTKPIWVGSETRPLSIL